MTPLETENTSDDLQPEAGDDIEQAEGDEAGAMSPLEEEILSTLKTVYDPEVPVDIYELGLIYQVDLEPDHVLKVELTLTAPGCPVAGEMPGWVRDACETVKGVDRADVTLTFDPPWSPDRMSDEAKLTLNMF